MTVEDYLAQGGTITKCPTVFLEPSINARDLGNGIGARYDAENALTFKERRARAMKAAKASAKAGRKNRGMQTEAMRNANEAAVRTRQVRIEKLCRLYRAGDTVATLAQAEGCSEKRIRDLLRAGGIVFDRPEPKGRQPRPTSGNPSNIDKRQMLLALHAEGLDLDEIAARMNTKRKNIREALTRAGMVYRVPMGRPPAKVLTPDEIAEIGRLYALGHGTPELSKRFGRSKCSIAKAVQACGLEIRKQGVYAPRSQSRQGGNRKGGWK